MASSKLKAIRTAMAAQIMSNTGIDSRAYVPDSITPPMIALKSSDSKYVDYQDVMGDALAELDGFGVRTYAFQILILLAWSPSAEAAQEAADDLIDGGDQANGQMNVPQAIQADPTLGGVVDFCEITNVGQVGLIEISGQSYFAARINVEASK